MTGRIPGQIRREFVAARHSGDIDALVSLGREVVEQSPLDRDAALHCARVLVELERDREALPYWELLRDSADQPLEPLFHIARVHARRAGSLEGGIEAACRQDKADFKPLIRTILKNSAEPADTSNVRHVAIAGVSYSGSTILDRILGTLSTTSNVGESHWIVNCRRDGEQKQIDFRDYENSNAYHCTSCGPRCSVWTRENRMRFAADRSGWYLRIARLLGTRILISADKNYPKLEQFDPLLRMDAVVLFKSPEQAWKSQLSKLSTAQSEAYYLEQLERYIQTWNRSYRVLLEEFAPKGRKLFLCFDDFARSPGPCLERLCDALELPFESAALDRIDPGHPMGGNARAMQRLRANEFRLEVVPLPDPGLPLEHLRILGKQTEMVELYQSLLRHSNELVKT